MRVSAAVFLKDHAYIVIKTLMVVATPMITLLKWQHTPVQLSAVTSTVNGHGNAWTVHGPNGIDLYTGISEDSYVIHCP